MGCGTIYGPLVAACLFPMALVQTGILDSEDVGEGPMCKLGNPQSKLARAFEVLGSWEDEAPDIWHAREALQDVLLKMREVLRLSTAAF